MIFFVVTLLQTYFKVTCVACFTGRVVLVMFLTNFNTATPLPSFFEMYAQGALTTGLKPALKYVLTVCEGFYNI